MLISGAALGVCWLLFVLIGGKVRLDNNLGMACRDDKRKGRSGVSDELWTGDFRGKCITVQQKVLVSNAYMA
jgi:hypothetical protein